VKISFFFFLFVVKSIRNRFILLTWKKKKPIKKKNGGWCGGRWPAIELVSLSLSFSQRVRFLFLQRLERRNLVFVWERERRTIHLHTLALWALAKKEKRKKSRSAVLSLLFSVGSFSFPSSLLGSPLCYEVSVTRFAHIQFGPCPPLLSKENNKNLTKDARIRKFLFIFKKKICLAVKNSISWATF
jgi:hypothetical protein